MSEQFSCIEPRVYYARWMPQMSLKQIAEYSQHISDMADADGEDHYTIIVDMSETKGFTMDVGGLVDIARTDRRIIAYVFIKGDNTAKFIGSILHQLSRQDFKFVETYEEALEYVRDVLQRYVV